MEILTAIKILGIILSGASIIGSERLSNFEAKLRIWIKSPDFFLKDKVYGIFILLGHGTQLLCFLLLFMFFVYISFGIPFPKEILDSLAVIRHLHPVIKVTLSLVLASMLIHPLFTFITPYGQIPPDFYTLATWVFVIFALIVTVILGTVTFPYLFIGLTQN